MSKMKQYIDLMTPMEAYQKGRNDEMEEESEAWCDGYAAGYKKGQEDVCTVPVSDIILKGIAQGRQEVMEWVNENAGPGAQTIAALNEGYSFIPIRSDKWRAQLKKWGIKNENCND